MTSKEGLFNPEEEDTHLVAWAIRMMRAVVRAITPQFPIRYVACGSGGGTTIMAIWKATQPGGILCGKVTLVGIIVSKRDAKLIERMIAAGFPRELIRYCPPVPGTDPLMCDEEAMLAFLRECNTDAVGLHGFTLAVGKKVIKAFKGRIFNQHPARIPENGGQGFYGLVPHEAAIILAKLTGWAIHHTELTVHAVTETYDRGWRVVTQLVRIEEDDTAETLQARALTVEHNLVVCGILKIAEYLARHKAVPAVRSKLKILPEHTEFVAAARQQALERHPHKKG